MTEGQALPHPWEHLRILDVRVAANNRYGYRWMQPEEISALSKFLGSEAAPKAPEEGK